MTLPELIYASVAQVYLYMSMPKGSPYPGTRPLTSEELTSVLDYAAKVITRNGYNGEQVVRTCVNHVLEHHYQETW